MPVGSAAPTPGTHAAATPPPVDFTRRRQPAEQTTTEQRLDAERVRARARSELRLARDVRIAREAEHRARARRARLSRSSPRRGASRSRTSVVYNEDVFAETDTGSSVLQLTSHYTTREQRDPRRAHRSKRARSWDDEKVDESARMLHDPLYSTVVALLPVKSSEPGKVDLLVVTRDIWSLRLNTQYTFQQGSLTNLSISLSENNFLGRRNVLALPR